MKIIVIKFKKFTRKANKNYINKNIKQKMKKNISGN